VNPAHRPCRWTQRGNHESEIETSCLGRDVAWWWIVIGRDGPNYWGIGMGVIMRKNMGLNLLLISLLASTFSFPFYSTVIYASEIAVYAKLGESFTLKEGQSAKITDIPDDVIFECKGFRFVDNGITVQKNIFSKFTINGEEKNNIDNRYYSVELVKSDFKTFATYTVIDHIKYCEQKEDWKGNYGYIDKNRNDCWANLATIYTNIEFCNNISISNIKDFCIERVLGKQQNPELCSKVNSPKIYCKYIQAVNEMNPQICTDIIGREYYSKCLKEISKQTHEGVKICDRIRSDKSRHVEECIDIINGTSKPHSYGLPLKVE
jgi:hypothetical protein